MVLFFSSTLLLVILYQVQSVLSDGRFELPPLPYNTSALQPHIGKKTLEIHNGKHHAKYVATLNSMIEEQFPKLKGKSLTDVVKKAYGMKKYPGLFNNAAQSWNHEFYWNCMTPKYLEPPQSLVDAIVKDFGSFQAFRLEFSKVGTAAFGSGWAWLIFDTLTKKLSIVATSNAGNPMAENNKWIPLLTMDVWEHAYYLDYQNMRPTYVETFLDKLVNWKVVASNLVSAQGSEAEL
jgi:Fe-Mn family superoxide dismutase